MKREYIWTIIAGLFIFGYALDLLSGPLTIVFRSPFDFLRPNYLSIYPFTAVSIAVKALALFMTVVMVVQAVSGQGYFLASALFFVIAALMELYSIQQIATNQLLIPLQWTLALAYGAVALLIPCFIYLIIGAFRSAHRNLSSDPYEIRADE